MTAIDRYLALQEAVSDIESLMSVIRSDCHKTDSDEVVSCLENAIDAANDAMSAIKDIYEAEVKREAELDEIEYRRAVGF